MRIIKDKDISSSLLSKSFGLLLQLTLVVYVAKELTQVESTIYFVIGILSQLTMALIYGFNSTLLRLVNYSNTGIPIRDFKKIKFGGQKIYSNDLIRGELLLIRKTILKILVKASIIYFLTFLLLGFFFLNSIISEEDLGSFWIYFIVYLLMNCLGISFSSEQIYLRGLGKVPAVEKKYLFSNLVLFLGIFFYILIKDENINVGYLLCISAASLLLPNLLLFVSRQKDKEKNIFESNSNTVKTLNKEIFSSTLKSGFTASTGSIAKNLSSLFVTTYFSIADSSSFLFTKKLIDIAENITITIYNAKIPSLNKLRVTDINSFKNLLTSVSAFTQNIFIIFAVVMIFFAGYFIDFLNFNSKLVATPVLILLLISAMMQRWSGIILASFNQSNNIIEHMYAIVSIIVLSVILIPLFAFELISFETMAISEIVSVIICSLYFFKDHYNNLNTSFFYFEKNLIIVRVLFLIILYLFFVL
jgi:hypothetical protein